MIDHDRQLETSAAVRDVTLTDTGAPVVAVAQVESAVERPSADEFDGYRVIKLVGRGAMGAVFLGHDTVLDRPVAIKFIATVASDVAANERFLREARAIARLSHPNVVAVHRAGEVRGERYLVSEFVRGKSLNHAKVPLPAEELLRVSLGLTAGLAAAHRRGVLHRDLKPANVLLADDGAVKLCDFGLAKLVSDASPEPLAVVGAPGGGAAVDLTRPGTSMGTPRYMAPEIWRGEAATVETDLYALGAIIYWLASGRPAIAGDSIDAIRTATEVGPVPLSQIAPEVDARLAALVGRCMDLARSNRPESAAEVHAELLAIAAPATARPTGNPYRGLHAFDGEHRSLFFGRATDAAAVAELLRSEPLVVVAGDSGVGKSSLCRAGILPLVIDGAMRDARAWTCARVVPGRRPLEALARALRDLAGDDELGLERELRDDPRQAVRRLGTRLGERRGLVVFVDQLEELVTESDPDEREAAARALAELGARVPGIRVLASARGDFLTRLAALPDLGRELSKALHLLGSMDRTGLREVITGPARVVGLSMGSEQLVDELVAGAIDSPAALPLLQFALAELWDRRDTTRGIIPSAALAEIGGVGGALARHADGVLAAMTADARLAARGVLTQLVTTDGTRAHRRERELVHDEPGHVALAALVRGRLLSAHTDPDGHSSFALAHEALLSGWATLRAWLDRDVERRAVHERLAVAAKEWERLGRVRTSLWSAPSLAEANRVELVPGALAGHERQFLDASIADVRRRAWRRGLLLAAIPVGILALWGGLVLKERMDRSRAVAEQLARAAPELKAAEASASAAMEQQRAAFASFEADNPGKGEELFTEARRFAGEADAAYQRAARPLEAALQMDVSAHDARSKLEESLYNRALIAEAFYDSSRALELMDRIRWLNAKSLWLDRWLEPATLAVAALPFGARVQIQRYEMQGTRRLLELGRELGTTPLVTSIAPGSYVLTLTSAGRQPVKFPVLVSRGARITLSIQIPAVVPPGFAYLPTGQFLYGSAEPDDLRKSVLLAPPQHQVDSPAYLVGEHEVTYGEYIKFLDALSPLERERRSPLADRLRLVKTGRSYSLTISPSSIAYTAVTGQPITYMERENHVSQAWERMPVSGVSIDDAEAYATWLTRSQGLKGARICTDREWERAARGADDRVYPHGDRLEPDDANFDHTYGQKAGAFGPDEVGSHPASNSPWGVSDLTGNVWEYVRSGPGSTTYFIRGGSFYDDPVSQRSTNRSSAERDMRERLTGVRICADADQTASQ